jgi:hypothetical protein
MLLRDLFTYSAKLLSLQFIKKVQFLYKDILFSYQTIFLTYSLKFAFKAKKTKYYLFPRLACELHGLAKGKIT